MSLLSPLNHKIWRLAWPMILSNISVPLLGLVDTAVLGHLPGPHYLGAVAIGTSLLAFLYWGFGFLRMGTTGLAAQALGASDHAGSRAILGQALVMALLLGLILIALHPWLISQGVRLLGGRGEIGELADSYTRIRIFSAPAVLTTYVVVGWLIGRHETRWPLLIMALANGLNIALDLWFVVILDFRSDGAAWATLISEYCAAGIALYVALRRCQRLPGRMPWQRLWQAAAYRRLVRLNLDILWRTLLLLAALGFFTRQGAEAGPTILAANTLLFNLLMLTSHGLDGFAHATEALIGRAVGRKRMGELRAVSRACLRWSLATAALYSLGFAVLQPWLISLLTNLDAVSGTAALYYPWLAIQPLIAVWSYAFDGIMIGATRSRELRNSMLLSVALVYLPVWWLTQGWGNHGLWLALTALHAARGLTLGWVYLRLTRNRSWWGSPSAQPI